MEYPTEVLPVSAAAIMRAARLLSSGQVVAFPTETVYGLGANALDEAAVRGIFEAKGRPADNPLIVHIAEACALDALVAEIPDTARALMRAYWPGPLTLIFPKKDAVPGIVSAGLSTVAVRMPDHPVAVALIREAGVPIAAPSANRSGRPSPTAAAHVLEDMRGRIPLILDGGACAFGVESTVVDVTGHVPVLLRPGAVTAEMLRAVLPELSIDPAVLSPVAEGAKPASPGMKHRHYAPNARVVIVDGTKESAAGKARALYLEAEAGGGRAVILCAACRMPRYAGCAVFSLGADAREMTAGLFDALRRVDREGYTLAIAEAADTEGIGLALMNRLLRAADFTVVRADDSP